jgi:anti-sigma factor ChrR (cupin superfamily)
MCPSHEQLSAFHDGQVDEETRYQIELHVALCGDCRKELAAMKSMSAMFAAAEFPRLSQISLHRLHRRVDAARDQGLIRAALAVCAMAACVLIVSSIWLVRATHSQVAQTTPTTNLPVPATASVTPPPWADVVASSSDLEPLNVSTPVAAWYLSSTGSEDSQR